MSVAIAHGAASAVEYDELVGRVRELVAEVVPEGSTVAVVSRGDGELVRLAGRTGWHFPRTQSGVYAGHHPADDADAIARLEIARQDGAFFLVLPATAYWWLDHYAGFRAHVESRYRRVAEREGTAMIFSLAGPALSPPPPADRQRDVMVGNVQALATALLPPGSRVLVASGGDERLLDLGGLTAWHFPQQEGGRHAPGEFADGAAVVAHLEALRGAGAEYMVIPRTELWWLERYAELRDHLAQACPLVVRQRHVCAIFELGGEKAAPARQSGRALSRRARG